MTQAHIELRLRGQMLSGAMTDAAGKGTLAVQAAGSYLLTVSKAGYVTNEASLEVHANDSAENLDVVLTPAALSQQNMTVEGTASNPVAEQAAPPQATLTGTQAKETTSKPATVIDALPLIPGIVRAKDGSVRVAGYGENHSTLLVNSVDVTDPATGGFGLSVPIDSVETVSVSEMPYLAQYGRFTAGVVTAETRRGGDKWDFSLNDPLPEFRIRSGHLQGLKSATPRLNLSGPIIADKLYFMEGAEYTINKQAVRTLPFPDNQTTSTSINTFTQFDAILSPTQTLTASFHFARPGPRRAADPGAVREAVREVQQERLHRRRGHRRSRHSPEHALRAHQERRAARPASPPPGARSPGAKGAITAVPDSRQDP